MKSRGGGWIDEEPDWLGPSERPQERAPPAKAKVEPTEEQLPIVIWIPVLCPKCRSLDCPVTNTSTQTPGMRYHKCRTCNASFKSFQRIPAVT
jgi:hypothetical protein